MRYIQRFTTYMGTALLLSVCLAVNGQDEIIGHEIEIRASTRGYLGVKVKVGRKPLAFVAHGGRMHRQQSSSDGSFLPFLGIHTTNNDLIRSYEGYRFGAGLAYRFGGTDRISFSISTTFDYARLEHELYSSNSSFSFSPFVPGLISFESENHSRRLSENHFFIRACISSRLHLSPFFVSLYAGAEPQINNAGTVRLYGTDGSKEAELLTETLPIFLGVGLGITIK